MKNREITTTELFEAMGTFSEEMMRQFAKCATKEDLKGFAMKEDLKGFAMKEDLKQFATKEDLKGFATKEDLKQFATKEDLKGFATKEDLKAIRTEMATKEDLKAFATKEDLKELKTEIKDVLQTEIGKVLRMFPPIIHKADSKANAILERMVQKRILLRKDIEDLLAIHPLLT